MRPANILLSALFTLALGAQTPPPAPPPSEAPKADPAKPQAEPAKPQETPAPAAPDAKPADAAKPTEANKPAEPATPVEATKPAEPVTPQAASKAILFFYRESRFVGAALRPSIFVDGIEVAYLSSGSYLKVAVAPGDHVIYADQKDDAMTFPTEAGKTYYFRVGIRAGFFKGHGKIEPMSEEAGAKEFESWKAKLTYTEKILKPEMVVKE